jgi:hypothetical protein
MTYRNRAFIIEPEHAKYEDSEFSDTEIEAFMVYFKVNTYDRLKLVLLAMKNRKW